MSNENPELLQLTSDHMLPILVNAIRELNTEIDELKERMVLLESKS